LPKDWNVTKPNNDYGQDLNIEICEDSQYRGLDLVVQLKASASNSMLDNTERQQLKLSTFNYLRNNLRVVLFVKYIEDEDEAYWRLLSDITVPANENQKSFTAYFPRENKISNINWNNIINYVRRVTTKKLAAMNIANRRQSR
jgi:hypothetical protein